MNPPSHALSFSVLSCIERLDCAAWYRGDSAQVKSAFGSGSKRVRNALSLEHRAAKDVSL
jgi:hypothetical protein